MANGARPHVRIQVTHGIELKQLTQVLEHAVTLGPSGCRACGLNGFDISFVVDPATAINVKQFQAPGVEGVTVSAA